MCFLGHLWSPLFILRATCWSSDVGSIFPFLRSTCRQIKELDLDGTELNTLESILLCRKNLLEDQEEVILADNLLEISLSDLISRTVNERRKFVNILLTIPQLFTPSATVLHTILFKPIIGIVPIETIIETI